MDGGGAPGGGNSAAAAPIAPWGAVHWTSCVLVCHKTRKLNGILGGGRGGANAHSSSRGLSQAHPPAASSVVVRPFYAHRLPQKNEWQHKQRRCLLPTAVTIVVHPLRTLPAEMAIDVEWMMVGARRL